MQATHLIGREPISAVLSVPQLTDLRHFRSATGPGSASLTWSLEWRAHSFRAVVGAIGKPLAGGARMERSGFADGSKLLAIARLIALVLIAATVLRFAWITDDALITVRQALNLSHGWGWGFNIGERVQAYTHPLWFGLVTVAGSVTDAWAVAPILLGLGCSTGAAAVILWSARTMPRIILGAALLLLSNAFIEYSTSGLENGLSFLLLAGAVALTARGVDGLTPRRSLVLGIIAGLVLLNRLDLVLVLAAPFALILAVNRRSWRVLTALVAPAVILEGGWMLTSQMIYSSPLPNTFLAKTNVHIPQGELLMQGLRYLYVSTVNDPVTGITLVVCLILAAVAGTAIARCWAAGIIAYLAYVVWIGGDFMAFRFLAVPVVIAVALIAIVPWTLAWSLPEGIAGPQRPLVADLLSLGTSAATVAALVAVSWGRADATLAKAPSEPRWAYYLEGGVSDERVAYAPWLGLWSYIQALGDTAASTERGNQGSRMVELTDAGANWPEATPQARITDVQVQCGTLGQDAILSGPLVHWIDTCALADRFLASRPYVAENYAWRPGHFTREVPDGYVEAVLQGSPVLLARPQDQAELAAIWEGIR